MCLVCRTGINGATVPITDTPRLNSVFCRFSCSHYADALGGTGKKRARCTLSCYCARLFETASNYHRCACLTTTLYTFQSDVCYSCAQASRVVPPLRIAAGLGPYILCVSNRNSRRWRRQGAVLGGTSQSSFWVDQNCA